MDFIASLFSGSPADTTRYNAVGLVVLLIGAARAFFCQRIAGGRERLVTPLRLAGLFLTVLGALITMKII